MRPSFASFPHAATRLAAIRLAAAGLAALALGACGDDGGGDPDAPAPDAQLDAPTDAGTDGGFVAPTMLSETGLYSDIGAKTIAAGVVEFRPRWELWSDEAVKRRWILLPPDTQIDTSDMDFWSFPVGTKLWKEFVRGGDRIETRLLQKIGPDDENASWFMVAFQWDSGETDAVAVPGGVVDDQGVNDIPDRAKCRQCHGSNRNPGVGLGFSALQLDYDAGAGGMDLERLVAEDRLTVEPTGAAPYFPLPAETGAPVIEPALGYLHANCGGCHNPRSDVAMNTVPVQLRLLTAAEHRSSWAVTPTYATAVNVLATLGSAGSHLVRPADTAQSAVYNRLNLVGGLQMPPVGRELVDPTGVAAVAAWIDSLPPP